MILDLRRICKNCADFDSKKDICTIRNVIKRDKTKIPMKRMPNQNGCDVFMMKQVTQPHY